MEFINFAAVDSDQESRKNFEEKNTFSENDNFIDDKSIEKDTTQPSFYRLVNHTCDPQEALNCNDQSHVDHRDLQPEMYIYEPRQHVEFHDFETAINYLRNLKRPSVRLKMWERGILFLALFYLDS